VLTRLGLRLVRSREPTGVEVRHSS